MFVDKNWWVQNGWELDQEKLMKKSMPNSKMNHCDKREQLFGQNRSNGTLIKGHG